MCTSCGYRSLLLYRNDNGIGVYDVSDDERQLEEIYQELLEKHNDQYHETNLILLQFEDGDPADKIYAEEIFIHDLDDVWDSDAILALSATGAS